MAVGAGRIGKVELTSLRLDSSSVDFSVQQSGNRSAKRNDDSAGDHSELSNQHLIDEGPQ